jgi:hypothetical protein
LLTSALRGRISTRGAAHHLNSPPNRTPPPPPPAVHCLAMQLPKLTTLTRGHNRHLCSFGGAPLSSAAPCSKPLIDSSQCPTRRHATRVFAVLRSRTRHPKFAADDPMPPPQIIAAPPSSSPPWLASKDHCRSAVSPFVSCCSYLCQELIIAAAIQLPPPSYTPS